jgi:hypothetical protein
MREGLALDAEAMTNLQSELHVTYHLPPGSASHFHRGSLLGRPPPLSGPFLAQLRVDGAPSVDIIEVLAETAGREFLPVLRELQS